MSSIIVRKESDEGIVEFRYNGSLTINIFIGSPDSSLEDFTEFDIITFMDKPALEEVIATCNERLLEYAEELTDSDLESLFESEAS